MSLSETERHVLDGWPDSEMGRRVAELDWSRTPLGPILAWPRSLTTAVRILLSSRYPMFVWWGPEQINIYNDAYIPILGARHPEALGRSAPSIWSEIWDILGEQSDIVRKEGRATWNESVLLLMERLGFVEETYFTFSYSPAPDDDGRIGGVFCACMEDTKRVLADRRLKTLRSLGERRVMEVQSASAASAAAATVLGENPHDIPFALIYLLDRDGSRARLRGSVNAASDQNGAAPPLVTLGAAEDPWKFRQVVESGGHVEEELDQRFGRLSAGPWEDDRTRSAIVLPLARPGVQEGPAGFLVAGLSPRLIFDHDYRGFLELAAGQIATAVANARAYEEERRRADALAEIDRAKTAFFSNVSHEFRTPLTLMLGPLEEAMAAAPPELREQLQTSHRNSLRLLKLVNTLLDFSRIEAGRIEASYHPVDLASATADLASVFRSAIEKAGMRLTVDTPPLSQPVYIDPEMWEKIVLNLLSNAFKYTLEGEIAVRLRESDGSVQLEVSDTGSGIPASELPKIFDRFHRIEGARGRSHEGTGIGLALVAELVKLQGGTVEAASEPGRGSTFTVTVPTGTGHLPPDRIRANRVELSSSGRREAWLGESMQWLPERETAHPPGRRARLLIADDNADMRHYVTRLLTEEGYEVEAVHDGEAALESIRIHQPDLVIADVMMPVIDGFALVTELRRSDVTKSLPVILLSARAGEEARVEGLQTGADDYLVKPFGAKELLARVNAHIAIARVRRQAELAARESERRFRNMADNAPLMSWVTEPSGACVFLNRPWREFTGQTLESGTGFGWLEAVHPEDRVRAEKAFTEANERRGPFRVEYRLRRHDGVYRWVIDSAAPWLGEDGEFLGYIGSVMDIDERKEAEERIQAATAKFEAVFNQSGIFAGVMDLDGRLREVNNLAVDACGYTREEVLGLPFWETPWWRGAEEVKQRIRAGTAKAIDGLVFRENLRYWLADGTERLVDFAIHPIRDASGRVLFLHPTGMDITDREAALVALRIADRVKDEFLATLSHELRTPLTSILGWAQMLRNLDHEDPIIRSGFENIERSARLQSQLIEDVLDVSRITTGKMRLELRPSDLREAIESAVETVRGAAEAKEITLSIDIQSDVDPMLVDPDRIRQIVWNLVSNAIKFTPPGGRVGVMLRRSPREAVIRVDDNGPGIPAEFLPHLFERFRQADSSSRRGFSGLGLGLALTKHLTELHGGSISVETEEGRGSSFVVRLPVADRSYSPREITPASDAPLQGMRILFVDDDPDAREMFGAMLKGKGGIVGIAESVDDALTVLDDFAPDLVVTDVAMPQRDGYDLLGEIRAHPRFGRIPVMALTAHPTRSDPAAGGNFSLVLTKPVDMDELIAAVAKTIER